MRKILIPLMLLILTGCFIASTGRADVSFGLSVGEEGIKSFYLAVGEHYQVPDKEIVIVKKQNIPNEEIPVVFYLARRAGTTPEAIIKLRLGGKTWMEITAHFGLSAEIYYVPVKEVSGPPYGKAYGHFKHRNRNQWREIKLTDDDVVNFVNLKFISEHYGCSPDEVVKMRENGKNFIDINTEVKKNKGQTKKETKVATKEDTPSKSKGKGKNK
jgi:hypothetical protein